MRKVSGRNAKMINLLRKVQYLEYWSVGVMGKPEKQGIFNFPALIINH